MHNRRATPEQRAPNGRLLALMRPAPLGVCLCTRSSANASARRAMTLVRRLLNQVLVLVLIFPRCRLASARVQRMEAVTEATVQSGVGKPSPAAVSRLVTAVTQLTQVVHWQVQWGQWGLPLVGCNLQRLR